MVSRRTTRGVMVSATLVFGRSDAGFSFGNGTICGTIRGAISPCTISPCAIRIIGETGPHSACGTP